MTHVIHQERRAGASLGPLALLCILGVAIRLAFLLLAGELELQSDEANYVYLALTWEYFGFYSDSYRYLWPPGYPFVLGLFLRAFDADGIFYYSSLSTVRSAEMFRSFDGGVTWGLPVPAFGGDKQWIAVDQQQICVEALFDFAKLGILHDLSTPYGGRLNRFHWGKSEQLHEVFDV